MKPSPGWASLRPALCRERRALVRLAAWSVLEMVPVLASGHLVALAVDRGFLAGQAGVGMGWLGAYFLTLLAGALGARQAFGPLSVVVESIRDDLVRATVTGALRAAARGATGTAAVTSLTRQTETVRQMVSALLLVVRSVVFSVGAVLFGLATLAPVLAWLTTGTLAVALLLLALLSPVLKRRYLRSAVAEEELAAESGQVLAALRDVAATGARGVARERVTGAIDGQVAATLSAARAGAGRIGVIAFGARLPLVLTLLLAPWLVSTGVVTPGQLLGAATYLVTGLEPALRAIVGTAGNLALQLGVVLDRLARQADVPPVADRDGVTTDRFEVALDGVTFAYGPHSAPVLDDCTLRLAHGSHWAVVGPSGIGKSTLATLIAGLTPPVRGGIRVGGVPIDRLSTRWLREKVVLVPQEAYVFSGTLGDNLRYLSPEATAEQLDAACAELGLTGLVGRLGGYAAELDAGTLSQGERQLITLCRVYLSRAEVVVLDEATCHLDPVAEAGVERAFAARRGTLVVIAHRISSAARAELILVMDGAGIDSGTHESLVTSSPLYADLSGRWRSGAAG